MKVPQRRMTTRRVIPKRRPLNPITLQMMVQSGVVRRADLDPPPFGSRARFHVLDDVDRGSVKEVVSEQGWLARLLVGRRPQFSVSKRS
ncbi:MAG: hypothetical protein KF722_17875 [Nitrospira sp.]|nr:hypothetical protein [Nitrospira sp.]